MSFDKTWSFTRTKEGNKKIFSSENGSVVVEKKKGGWSVLGWRDLPRYDARIVVATLEEAAKDHTRFVPIDISSFEKVVCGDIKRENLKDYQTARDVAHTAVVLIPARVPFAVAKNDNTKFAEARRDWKFFSEQKTAYAAVGEEEAKEVAAANQDEATEQVLYRLLVIFGWKAPRAKMDDEAEKIFMTTRTEKDSMGEFQVPSEAYYGAQTARAVANFPVSGVRFPRPFIQAVGAIKRAAAEVNVEMGLLDETIASGIYAAADEVIAGKLDGQFVVDIYQTGSGTSTNMNANEVLSNRAIEIMGGVIGSKSPVHPNDHVNKSQSSNDVIPTAIHVAGATELQTRLLPALQSLHAALRAKADAWDDIVKIGRTHLMDATPVRLGQEASGWARQVELSIARLESVKPRLMELAIGGTAVGTGINSPEGFGAAVAAKLAARFDLPFVEAENHFEAQGSQDAAVELANQLSTVATSLLKIANDVRWLSSGPRCGLGELSLPAVQPGSSIMPGKVNPVICEQLIMVCAQVIGNAVTVTVANTHGNLDLNVMLPVMARNVLESVTFLANSVQVFTEKAVGGLTANKKRAESLVEWSMSMVTSLVPVIGYDNAAILAKRAVGEGRTVRDLCLSEPLKATSGTVLTASELNELLDARKMTEPGVGAGGE